MKFSAVVALLAAASSSLACTTDDDCSLNGVCQGTCLCDAGWIASDCSRLDLRPPTRYTGYNRTAEGVSSWGAKIVQDPADSTIFHLFVAQFAHNCSLDYWTPYSTVVRATSTSGPEGPYQFEDEVVGTFAHNPTVIYSEADGLYLLIHIGCPVEVPAGCGSLTFSCGPGNTNNGESGISAWSSPDLRNWEFRGQVMPGDLNGTWDSDTSNPSPCPLWAANDHTHQILMAYRGCIWNCGDGLEQIGIAVAPNFTGPYVRAHDHPLFPSNAEDPFVWRDKRGHFHMLVHSLDSADSGVGSGPRVGRHAYARSWGGQWTYNNQTLAYSTHVTFTDGMATNYSRRERPQLYFSDDGLMTPLFLSNGVQEAGTSQSYTLVQPIGEELRRSR
jgi:Glycosyl hydrolases family 43